MLPSLRRITVKDAELSRVQDGILQSLNPVLKKEVLDGVLAEDIELTVVAQQIAHGLGRDPLGYFIVSKSAFADVIDTLRDTRTITLQANAPVTVSLWIF